MTLDSLSLPSDTSLPLVEQLTTVISERIEARDLTAGSRLPSIRRLADRLGVSKTTVVEAYDRLVAAGQIQSRAGSGFYVSGRRLAVPLSELEPRLDRAIDPIWVARQSLEMDDRTLKPGCGWLPNSWLEDSGLRRALRQLAGSPQARLHEYGHPLGYLPLRQQLQIRLAEFEIDAAPSQILLTDGGTQAIDLVNRFLLEPGDSVLVDDPGYFNFHANLKAHRAKLLSVPRRVDGPDLDRLQDLAIQHRPKLYLTNGTPHNPTSASMAPAIAHRLLTLAETQDFLIVEDDIFADLRRQAASTLAALDGLRRVIYLGSFSKTVSAGLRCGFIVARPDLIQGMLDLKIATCFGSNQIAAQTLHRILADGSYRKHADSLRTRLGPAMAQVLRRLRPLGLEPWIEPREGMFLWMKLPDKRDAAELARAALRADIVLAPGNVFSPSESWPDYLRFNVAQSQQERLTEFLRTALRLKGR